MIFTMMSVPSGGPTYFLELQEQPTYVQKF
jgi:hypothetical protein